MTTNPGENGLENWTRLFRNLKSLFLTLITQIWIKSTSKTTYSYSAWRNLSIGKWYDLFWRKFFIDFFGPKGKRNHENWPKLFFIKYGQITHQSIDLVELSKIWRFLRYFWFIFDWFVSKKVILWFLYCLIHFSFPFFLEI